MEQAVQQSPIVTPDTTSAPAAGKKPVEYGGPHPLQIQPWARAVRRLMRHKEYTRWVDQYCKPLTVVGQDRLDQLNGPAIFIANHQSHMDTPVILESLPEHIKDNIFFGAAADRWFVKGKKKLILQPWYQSMVLGNFPIVRGGGSKTLAYGRWLLDQGCNICIFPEGTRRQGDDMGDFRHGVTLLARAANVPVVPVVLKGLREMRPKGSREITPGPASASILDPIHLSPEVDVEVATGMLRDAMMREFANDYSKPEETGLETFTREKRKDSIQYINAKAA